MKPTLGRIVHYTLSEHDVLQINERHPQIVDGRQTRNGVSAGDVRPAQIVQVWSGTTVNLKVSLDGEGEYWATSRQEGDSPFNWAWPTRV